MTRARLVAATAVCLALPVLLLRDSKAAIEVAVQAVSATRQLILSGYHAAPALMLCLATVAGIIAAGLVVRLGIWFRRDAETTRRHGGPPHAGRPEADDADEASGSTLPGHAYVEVVGAAAGSNHAIFRDMLRIGREEDNDIRFESRAVHRYHAAIHREELGDYWITDLSGLEGNGVIVNGRKCGDARLRDGDLIECGPGQLRFHAGLV